MTERTYHHGSLGPALIQAGLDAAREAGPAALTVRDLARRAGVSPAAAYRHFPDLDHLVAEVSRMARQELAQAMIDARDALPNTRNSVRRAWASFGAIGEAYVRFALTSPRLFETAFVACSAAPTAPEHPSAWEVLTDSIDGLVEVGAIAAARPAEAPLIAWAAVHGLSSILVGNTQHAPIDADAAIASVLAGVCRSLT